MIAPRRGLVAVLAAALVAAAFVATAQDGVTRVQRGTGTDVAALARRVQAVEERLDSLWSLRQGPDVLSVDTLDRLTTRLLAAEARLASIERGPTASTQALQVATSASLLSTAQPADLVRSARSGDFAALAQLRYLAALVRLTPWPQSLTARAQGLQSAIDAVVSALGRGEPGDAERLVAGVDVPRRQLVTQALAWTSQASAPQVPGAHAHMDHSPRHGGQLGMRGDLHVEVVGQARETGGAYQVFLSDAVRAPLRGDGVSGEVVLFPDGQGEIRSPLKWTGTCLEATCATAPGEKPLDLRVRLEGTTQGAVEMDFQLPPAR